MGNKVLNIQDVELLLKYFTITLEYWQNNRDSHQIRKYESQKIVGFSVRHIILQVIRVYDSLKPMIKHFINNCRF